MRRAALVVVLGALALGTPAPAAAQGKKPGALDPKLAEAKRLFDHGAELYGQGSYEQAIAEWERSYEISKKPLIFESIANAYERLGKAAKAREYLARWREAAPPEEHELLDARIKNLEARSREERAEAARQEAAARADRERAERERAARAGAGTSIPGAVLAAGGAGAVIVGVTLDLIAAGRRPGEDEGCVVTGERRVCSAAVQSGIESSNTLATVGDIAWIVGGVAAAAGVFLIVTHEPAPAPASAIEARPACGGSAIRIAPLAGPSGGGLSVAGRF